MPRNGPAKHRVREFEPGAARQRFHADPAIAELAVAAGLLFMAPLNVRRPPNGFPVRNLRRMQLHFHAVSALQAAHHHFHMLLPRSCQQEFIGHRIAIEPQRRIFLQNLRDRNSHAVFVLPRLG